MIQNSVGKCFLRFVDRVIRFIAGGNASVSGSQLRAIAHGLVSHLYIVV
jgi:hypothetical protein